MEKQNGQKTQIVKQAVTFETVGVPNSVLHWTIKPAG